MKLTELIRGAVFGSYLRTLDLLRSRPGSLRDVRNSRPERHGLRPGSTLDAAGRSLLEQELATHARWRCPERGFGAPRCTVGRRRFRVSEKCGCSWLSLLTPSIMHEFRKKNMFSISSHASPRHCRRAESSLSSVTAWDAGPLSDTPS